MKIIKYCSRCKKEVIVSNEWADPDLLCECEP